MRIRVITAVLFASMVVAEPTKPQITRVPHRTTQAVEIDGRIRSEEWDGSHELLITPDVTLMMFHTKDDVLLAVRLKTAAPAYVDMFLLLEDEKRVNLHASMQVGERELPSAGWTDRAPPTHWGKQDRWQANFVRQVQGKPETAPLSESLVPYDGFEFRLSKDRFGRKGWRLRLEVRDFMGERKDIVFPTQSNRMDVATWAEFSLSE